jgi:hypothetical protein
MAKYTVELRDIVKSGLKIFNFDYEFYDNEKKGDFEQKFINHFLFREIGVETVGRFQHYLKCKCDEVLPYYNVLLKTALYEYDLKNNYNLTETFSKTNSNIKTATGNVDQNSTKNDNATMNNTLNRSAETLITGEKTNTLESTTDHDETIDYTKNDTLTETGKTDTNTTVDVDNKKVNSKTPNGLLSMPDIVSNVYASTADIEDNTIKTVDGQTNTASKVDELKEDTKRTTKDMVDATSHDSNTDTHDETINETNSGTNVTVGTFVGTTNTTQNENDNGSESYTLERVGDIGVDTTPDKIKKHVEIQKILTTAYLQFFNECEDLFMQIY